MGLKTIDLQKHPEEKKRGTAQIISPYGRHKEVLKNTMRVDKIHQIKAL